MNPAALSSLCLIIFLGLHSCTVKYSTDSYGEITFILNDGGQTLGMSENSGLEIITADRSAFKDLNRNGKLDVYEDWRLPAEERAGNLASLMSDKQIAGLMLHSMHQAIPSLSTGMFRATYNGKSFEESGMDPGDLSDDQTNFLTSENLRHVLITSVETPGAAAQWNNNAQALVEGMGLGIPVMSSSDPRHGSDSYAEYNAGAGGKISMWPSTLGLAASFDPDLMEQFGRVASKEYRALGLATALSPQIDLGTEPRWARFDGGMGEDPGLVADMARACVDGFQTTAGSAGSESGWGPESVMAMVKHWPGGGSGEGGRDAHFGYGAYAVYPGNNMMDHLLPFTGGVFKLKGATGTAAAVMPYYTISYGLDPGGENVGNGFSRYLVTDLLRNKYGYNGVVCTDWLITGDAESVHQFRGKCWGVEALSAAERCFKALEAGVDQFGGMNSAAPVLEAFGMGFEKYGEEPFRERIKASAKRLLLNIFRAGLFENPYLEIEVTERIVGNPDFMELGYQAQVRSVIMLKNKGDILPLEKNLKVYVPLQYTPAGINWFGKETPEKWEHPFNMEIVARYFTITDSPGDADFALVGIRSPQGGPGYDVRDLEKGGNGYVPVSLQYEDYTAVSARDPSIAGGSPFEDFINRSYKDKTVSTINSHDLQSVRETAEKLGEKPLIVSIKVSKPMIFGEFEELSSAILVHMGVQNQALLEIITGGTEPSALLPFQMPADMQTVEEQYEDVPRDMSPHLDSDGHAYDFAFGLNWSGVISDERVSRYR